MRSCGSVGETVRGTGKCVGGGIRSGAFFVSRENACPFLFRGKPHALLWRRTGKYGLPGKFLNKSRTAFLAVLYAFPAVGFDGILKRKRETAAKVDMRPKILLQGYCKVAYEKQEPKKSAPLEP